MKVSINVYSTNHELLYQVKLDTPAAIDLDQLDREVGPHNLGQLIIRTVDE